jgi:tetratricopeptide (TPR) repeat protein
MLSPAPANCAQDGESAAALIRRAERAREERDFDAAELLYRRYLTERPDGPFWDVARFRAGETALDAGRFDAALADFALLSRSDTPLAERASLWLGLTHYRRRAYDAAREQWAQTARTAQDDNIAAEAQYGAAWSSIRLHDWATARRALERFPVVFRESQRALGAAALAARIGQRASSLPLRSPEAARWLSTFLPGAGQVYAGRVGNGLVSLAINGAFVYVTARAVADGRWVDAGFLYLAGARFYWGGRQNAAKFARERNEQEKQRFIRELEAYDLHGPLDSE